MSTLNAAIDRARRYLDKIPGAISGQDGHNQTFSTACSLLKNFELSEGEVRQLLGEYNQRCVPPWSERELDHKLADAARGAGRPSMGRAQVQKSRPTNPAREAKGFLGSFTCTEADLWEASPIRLENDFRTDGALLAGWLYQRGELINFVVDYQEEEGKARPAGVGLTLERDEFVGRYGVSAPTSEAGGWLRMNPVDGKGVADENVTSFRFGLLESDALPLDMQLALWGKLPLPIAAILTSGGRSVHAWVVINAPDMGTYRGVTTELLGMLGKFGVDHKNKNPSRLSRMPGAYRKIGAAGEGRQRLLYLNPNPEQRPIFP